MWTPATLEACLEQWGLTPVGEVLETRSSQLVPVELAGRAGILKLALIEEEARGNGVLAWWNGSGAAPVWRVDEHSAVLERAPGGSLAALAREDDDAATRTLCTLAGTLHGASALSQPPLAVVALREWFRELFETADARPDAEDGLWRRAADLAAMLLADESQHVVLHGDLHHDNVLDFGGGDWRAIDPKGVYGNRLFDYTVLLRNPEPAIAEARLEARVGIIAEASGAPRRTVLEWAVASIALSAAWSANDGDHAAVTTSLRLARLAERMLGTA